MAKGRKRVYALQLAGGNAYVGVATDPERRISDHTFNHGHHWTTRHRPRRVLGVHPPVEDYLELENAITLGLARALGTERVAGGRWTGRTEHHFFPKPVREAESPGWDVFGDRPGVSVAEYLGLDPEIATDIGVPLE